MKNFEQHILASDSACAVMSARWAEQCRNVAAIMSARWAEQCRTNTAIMSARWAEQRATTLINQFRYFRYL